MPRFDAYLKGTAIALGLAAIALADTSAATASENLPTARTAQPSPEQRPKNVLLIISDDLATRLGAYGWNVNTPNIDRLASQGVTFERAYSQFPWCGPSRASFLTGTRPDTNGVRNLWTPLRQKIPDLVTLPQHFRQQGFFTGRVGKVFHQGVPDGIGKPGPDDPLAWDIAVDPRGRDVDIQEAGKLHDLSPGIPYGSAMTWYADEGPETDHTDAKVATAAIEMLKDQKDRPFFIAVGFYRPHVPEVAPQKYYDLYPIDEIEIDASTPEELKRVLPASRAWAPDHFGMTADEQRQMIRGYYAATSFMDAQVGRMLDAVDELGLSDSTVIVFLSDHGFLLGEHGQWMKNVLWDQSAKTPLILRAPGVTKAGGRSPRVVELLDLYPTLTDLIGLPANERNEGRSLRPLLTEPQNEDWTKAAFSQVMGGRSVHTERWRYTEWQGGEKGRELYDHIADPAETRNLAEQPAYNQVVTYFGGMLASATVEQRNEATEYDPVRNCLLRPLGAPPNPVDAGKPGVARICEAIDP